MISEISSKTKPDLAGDGANAFGTEHLRGDLRGRAVSGGIVTVIAQVLRFALQLGSAVVLARLLTPADFGLVALVLALIGVLRMLKDAGLSTATVQRSDITHIQVSNLFWINLSVGAALTASLAAAAPIMVWFYQDGRLFWVTVALSFSFLMGGAAVQHLALLNRQMRFKAIMLIDVTSMLMSFIVGVGMAAAGWGYWSLVGAQLSMSFTETVLAWSISSWRPQRPRRGGGTRPLLAFGASMTMSNFLRRLATGADVLLIGRFYGTQAVGLYSRAGALLMRPLDYFMSPFDVVFIPLLSRLQDESERYRRTFLRAYGTIALASFPLAGFLLALPRQIVLCLLGPKWIAVIPIFGWSALAAVYIPLGYAAMWLLTTQGRSRDILIAGAAFSGITLGSILAGLPFGPIGVACALSLGGLLVRIPFQHYLVGRKGPVSAKDLWLVFFRNLPLFIAVVGGSRLGLALVPGDSIWVQAFVGTSFGVAGAGAIMLFSSPHRQEAFDLLLMAKDALYRPNGVDNAK